MSERSDAEEVAELRLTVEDQARYIEVLLARLETMAGQEVDLRDLAATLREQVGRADADIRRLEAALAQARADARLAGRPASPTPAAAVAAPPPVEGAAWRGRLVGAGRRARRVAARALPWLAPLYRRVAAYRRGRRG